MTIFKQELLKKGVIIKVNAAKIQDKTVIVTGSTFKIAQIKDDNIESCPENPNDFIDKIKHSGLKVDIFTFMQNIPDCLPRFPYFHEQDNYAVILIDSFEQWVKNHEVVKKSIKKSSRAELEIKTVSFSDDLVHGIKGIFDEMPVRQGKAFWHYGKDFTTIKKEMIDRVDTSYFVGAYYRKELIGFVKLIHFKESAYCVQILSKVAHRDKAPNHALIAHSYKVCLEKKIKYLIYEHYEYGKKGADSLTEFKRRNGFIKMEVPRYYIPFTLKGALVLRLGMHHGFIGIIPKVLLINLLSIRTKYDEWRTRGRKEL